MPSPVFLREGAYGGARGPRPYKVFRRAALPSHRRKGRTGSSPPTNSLFFPLKALSAPKMGRSVLLDFDFYFLALLSTTWRSRAANASRDMAPRSPSARCRGETVPFSMSRSPTTTM